MPTKSGKNSKPKVTLESLGNKLERLDTKINAIAKTMVTTMATKDDLLLLATKNEVNDIKERMATRDDLRLLRDDLSSEIETLAIMTKNEFDRVHATLAMKIERTAVIRR